MGPFGDGLNFRCPNNFFDATVSTVCSTFLVTALPGTSRADILLPSDMAGAPPPRVVVTAVDLHDLVPSARALTGCVRSVLFGIVEECARRATATDSSPVEDEDVDEEDAAAFLDARKRLLTDMVEHGFCAVDDADATLPTQFGKAKKKAKTKTKPTPRAQHNRKPLRREGRATAVPGVILRCPLPVPDDEATMAEHNIFLMPYPPDPPADGADGAVAGAAAMLYPVRVVGNAPFSTHTGCHGVVIEYLGYDDGPYCVPRQALRPVPAPPSASSSSPLAQAPAPADCSRFASTHRREIKGLLDQTLFPPAPAHLPDDVVKVNHTRPPPSPPYPCLACWELFLRLSRACLHRAYACATFQHLN